MTNMDMLLWTALIKYHCQHAAEVTPLAGVIDPPLGIISTPDIPIMITRIGTGSVVPDPTHITMDIGVAAVMTPARAAPDHSTDPHIHDYSCHRSSSSYRYCHDTPHCRSSSHRNLSQDDSRSQPHKSHRQHLQTSMRIFLKFANNTLEK